ncbi:MAG: hypothetical protein D6755_05520 [Anaerolineae bacterium]|nr:MAG: hypothetical protein D6755_05520 [Anaerolineae bacterium]
MPKFRKKRPGGGPPPNLGRRPDLHRTARRQARREAFRQQAQSLRSRPRPAVRPASPPRPVMPARPAAPAGKRRLRSQGRVPAHRPASTRPVSRPAVMAAGALALNAALAHPELQSAVQVAQHSLERVQQAAALEDLREETADLDARLNRVVDLLESAREKGYVFQGDMDEQAYQAISAWQSVHTQVQNAITMQASSLQNRLQTLAGPVGQLNAVLSNPALARPRLQQVENQINTLEREALSASSTIREQYADILSTVSALEGRLRQIHWALEQLEQARFSLQTNEDLVMAVRARWDKEGKDDPEGVLYLTNRRLIFERKEKLARKKVLFITVDSELVQEVLIDQPVDSLKEVKAVHKGLFGHQDFLHTAFTAAGLGSVAFHLDGQDSQDWDVLIRKVQRGDIEAERATATGVSLKDLTKPLTQADLLALQNEVNALQDDMMLKPARAELERLEGEVTNLARRLEGLRSRGYVVEKSLEDDVQVLSAQWERIRQNAGQVLEQQTALLAATMQGIQSSLGQLLGMAGNLSAARPLYMQIKSALASAQAQAEAASDTVFAQFDAYDEEVSSLDAHFDWVAWMLDALETATFQLMATESGVVAVEAQWLRPGLEPENGVLFLTDQRLLWEDRVGDFELKFNVPLTQVTGVRTEPEDDEATDIIACALSGDAPVAEARFLLAQPVGEAWVQMLNRARAGDYTQDRTQPVDQAELERIRQAPTECSNCGAPLSAPILRGQTEITCAYCGAVMRF